MQKNEWTITAQTTTGRTIEWSYDRATDANRAWKSLSREWRTIDTGDEISSATITRPDGSTGAASRVVS